MDVDTIQTDPTTIDDVVMTPSSSRDLIQDDGSNDGDHRRIDEEVQQVLAKYKVEWRANPSLGDLVLVLRAIIEQDPRLDRKYADLQNQLDLLEKHPWIKGDIATAWKEKSYRNIRRLAILHPTIVRQNLSPEQLSALRGALSRPFRGDALDAFLNYLEENGKAFNEYPQRYYAKFCSIVQSSGCGKTRLMLELGTKNVFVLYMNIRSPEDTQGYPPRDDIPANILTARYNTEQEYSMRCRAFFAAVFKVLGRLPWTLDWCHKMRDIGNIARTEFFLELEDEFGKVLRAMSSSSSSPTEIMKEYYEKMAAGHTNALSARQNTPMVIALDEAHVLHEHRISGSGSALATVLLRVIKEYSELLRPVWVVFASTTSRAAHYATPQTLYPSQRVAIEGQLLFPPFTQLGWDQHAPSLKDALQDDVATGAHIIKYGRPLWMSLSENRNTSLSGIVNLAGQKLCGVGMEAFNLGVDQQAFAVLAQRFGLDITFGHRNAVRYVEDLVASHLRVCIKTTEDRIWSYTTYPSEPILSCAAANVLHSDDNLVSALNSLAKMAGNSVINVGDIGELVSRFLWLLAKDFFVREPERVVREPKMVVVDTRKLLDCHPVPVTAFLEFFLGPRVWNAVPGARKEFENAYINFSHWVSMDFDITPRGEHEEQLSIDDWTASHWVRTGAIQCCHQQPAIDKVIPMYFKPGFNHQGISHIFISDKARNRSQRPSLGKIKRGHEGIAPGYHGLPYIAVLLDLGVKSSKLEATLDPGKDGEDMCFRIYAGGLDENTYPFLEDHANLSKTLKDLYTRLSSPPGPTYLEKLEDRVQFGRSREARYMNG
ncbi:hypothetical protein JVU11DRAFT_6543 [Chiua virens]|nr:hypothetical protein JVU11DRAFT_6543 [Chiua virens]